ncbi:MAG: glycosyltransferase [Methylococcales bacterium]|nr:glycosyltransferase [Methylococcales bacterium]
MENAEKLALLNFVVKEFDLKQHIFPQTESNSSIAAQFILQQFYSHNLKADLIYWDYADFHSLDSQSITNYLNLLSRKGIICVDGDVTPSREIFCDVLEPILEAPNFSVYARPDGENPIHSMRYRMDIFRRKHFVETTRLLPHADGLPLVAVVVLAYCHEKYITECLNSILMQKGNFRMRVIILDDASPDKTAEVARTVITGQSSDRIEFDLRSHPNNIGMVKNFGESIRLAADCDYLTFCEGDDFWSSDTRIQQHLDFLAVHSDCVMSFNTIEKCEADGSAREIFSDHANNPDDIIDGLSLAANNLCGNLAACFYHGSVVKVIPEQLFDLYTGDWLFNMYCSQFGGVGHLKKPLSVYRVHSGGEWSMRPVQAKLLKTWGLIGEYNAFLDFQFDEGFQQYKKSLLGSYTVNSSPQDEKIVDLLIFDDVFPSSRSGFRLAEFTSYMREFPKSMVVTSGLSLSCLEDKSLEAVVQKFQRQYPDLAHQILIRDENYRFPIQLAELVYINFLTNAYTLLPLLEEEHVPFAFTLYPGAGLRLNDSECDSKLKRVFDSPCFLKVIVTQQITFDYIVDRNLCPIEKVVMLFGVVMPQEAFTKSIVENKQRWGFGKNRLDICFMAHRYTQYGEDKGYDVFVNVASILCQRHDNIYFHVVGPYDHRLINVTPFKDKIEFHGSLNPEQFNDFFQNIDIILSPNISGQIFPGSFDGFPTASCTEAGLRGAAIFATDEFNSGVAGRFTDGENIVLLKYDLEYIVSKVEEYYNNPAKLKLIGEQGRCHILDLYSYESQMLPRITLLRELMETTSPESLKRFYRNPKRHTFRNALTDLKNKIQYKK